MDAFHLLKMISELKKLYPEWVNNDDYDLMLTDDLDSLASIIFLQQIRKGYNIQYFYDFKTMYSSDNNSKRKALAIDCDLCKGKSWSNHCTMLSQDDEYNDKSANINNILKINRKSYFDKYSGSTLLQIISYFDWDISKYNEEQLMVLCAIDGYYIPWFPWIYDFRPKQKEYLENMQLTKLIDVFQQHTYQDFINIVNKYGLNKKIKINKEGRLKTEINLPGLRDLFNLPFLLPDNNYTIYREFKPNSYNLKFDNTEKIDKSNLFSMAITGKNYMQASLYC